MTKRTVWTGLVCVMVLVGGLWATGPAAAARPEPLGRAASAPPTLAFEETSVVAGGFSEGEEVVFFAVARIPLGFTSQVETYQSEEIADFFGEARFDLGKETPLKSVWAVVSRRSGAFVIGAPEGFSLREVEFPRDAFHPGATGAVSRIRHRFPWVDLLVVRPQVGAWHQRVSDGGGTDRDDQANGRPETDLEDLVPIGLSPGPPERLTPHDVVVAINPRDLRFYAATLVAP